MRRGLVLAGLTAGALLLGQMTWPAWASEDDGTPVALASLPSVVQNAIRTNAASGKISEITKTTEDGEGRYTLDITKARSRTFTFNDQGEVVARQVFLRELSRPIQQAIHQQAGRGRIEDITRTTEDGEVSYDVEMVKEGKARTFSLGEDGKVLEIEVFLEELPVEAREALEKEAGEGKCGEITKTDEEGETLYETEITRNGKPRSVSVNAKGQVVYQEESIALADAPDAVQKAFHAQLDAGAGPSKICKITSDGEVSYLGEWMAQGACRTLTVAADGKALAAEPESPAETTAKP
jgi:uncharacterized membrane protein YkoI